ncbi:MAG: UvrD-helicase domain-containing protein, partial [Pseudomonadota bacterium]|nr:UvrD-helicase domain-containing protein [Pseudomonadota bacterium]
MTGAIAALYRHIGADPEVTPAQARAALASGGADADLRLLAAAWAGGSASEQDRGASLTAWLATPPAARTAAYDGYRGLFLTTKGQVRKSLVTKATAEAHPGALAVAEAEADRLVAGEARFRAAVVARASAAVTTLGAAMLTAYERAKQARDWLDYEDLILRTRRLLMAPGGPSWVLYKLDGGIDHILVDEAQDTNPAQWQVIAKLAEGFFDASAGMGARSVFAVGDIKQSIFSFQGADPAGLTVMRRHFANAVGGAGGQWDDVPMNVSFRSAPAILAAVDAVFADPELAAAVGEEVPIRHVSARPSVPGSVELWAPVTVGDEDAAAIWAPPDRQIAQDDPRHILAERIAGQVRQWLDDGTALASGERPIEAGDVMVLVRRRDALVEALARAFKRQGIPVAGVDRMILTDQLAVMDLIKLGEFLLLP